jgi:hypothetical protein
VRFSQSDAGAFLAKPKDKAPPQAAATHVSINHERNSTKHPFFGDIASTGQDLPDLLLQC